MQYSSSYFFEVQRNWTGLLIEPNPFFFAQLLRCGRQAFVTNACLSTSNQSKQMTFLPYSWSGRLAEGLTLSHRNVLTYWNKKRHLGHPDPINVQCFTLYSLLLALNRLEVTYLALDVEGNELDILSTIPFGKVIIHIRKLEYRGPKTSRGAQIYLQKIQFFLKSLYIYQEVAKTQQDVIFQRRKE